jgi:hypothetical protein
MLHTGIRKALKMWGRKTRDIIIETAVVVRGLEKSLKAHDDDNDEKFEVIHDLIEKCSESCPAEKRFDNYVKNQNGSLSRIEQTVGEMKAAKKTRREMLSELIKYVTIAALVIGSFFAYIEYRNRVAGRDNTKVEQMLEEILNKT